MPRFLLGSVGSVLMVVNLVLWAALAFWLYARGEQLMPRGVNIGLMLTAAVCFALCYQWIDRRFFPDPEEERRRQRAGGGEAPPSRR